MYSPLSFFILKKSKAFTGVRLKLIPVSLFVNPGAQGAVNNNIGFIKMQSEGLIKPDLSEKEYDQLFEMLTGGEY